MAKKIVDDILAAEEEGEKIIAQAEEESRRIVADAKARAKDITDTARLQNAARLKKAVEAAQSDNETAAQKAKSETARLREDHGAQAAERKTAAITRVIEILRQP